MILPQPFTLVTPVDRQQVTDGQTVIFEWTLTGAPARVSLDYTIFCTLVSGSSASSGKLGTDSNSDGREFVRIDPIVEAMRSGTQGTISKCDIDVSVHHELSGRIDRAFHGGTAVGIVTRMARLEYIPR